MPCPSCVSCSLPSPYTAELGSWPLLGKMLCAEAEHWGGPGKVGWEPGRRPSSCKAFAFSGEGTGWAVTPLTPRAAVQGAGGRAAVLPRQEPGFLLLMPFPVCAPGPSEVVWGGQPVCSHKAL